MQLHGWRSAALIIMLGAGLATACAGEPEEAPVAETKAETPTTPVNAATTIQGCLKAGEAAGTFVLTATSAAEDGAAAATYELTGAEGVDLAAHTGERVEVQGVITAAKETDMTSATRQAEPAKPGVKPEVATSVDVNIRRLDVSRIQKIDGSCEM